MKPRGGRRRVLVAVLAVTAAAALWAAFRYVLGAWEETDWSAWPGEDDDAGV